MLPPRLARLLNLLGRLPGVGEKTAQRFGLWLIQEREIAKELSHELAQLVEVLQACEHCGHIAERNDSGQAICSICTDHRRDPTTLCVVGRVQDLLAIERSGAMRGRYFVLGRLLSPLDGIGPGELPIARIQTRIRDDQVQELIIATPPSVDGEATALFLARELAQDSLNITRLASGIPHGGDLEYLDQITLGRAIDGRKRLDS